MSQESLLRKKTMKSLRNTSTESGLINEPTNKTSIAPPTNELKYKTHTMESDIDSLIPKNTTKTAKRRKTLSRPMIIDSLNANDSTKQNHKKRAKKSDYSITYLGERETDLIYKNDKTDDMSSIMKEFDIDEMKQKSNQLKEELDLYRIKKGQQNKDSKIVSKYLSQVDDSTLLDFKSHKSTANTIKNFHKNSNQQGDKENLTFQSLLNNKDKYDKVKKKYVTKMPYINENIIESQEDIKKIVDNYKNLLIDILNGKVGSYFYNYAKKLQQSSNRSSIRGDEIMNMPKNKYYGYIGAIRGFHIGKGIEQDEELEKLLNEKKKFSKVIKFWGLSNFAQYVLAPEVIAHIILKQGNLVDLDAAYDQMEETNEYGIFVTDTKDIKGKDAMQHVKEEDLICDDEEEYVEVVDQPFENPSVEHQTNRSKNRGESDIMNISIITDKSDFSDKSDSEENLIDDIFG